MKTITFGLLFFMSSFGFSQDWKIDFEAAKKLASDQDKNIIIVFSGSDWCAPCIKLDKNIWQSYSIRQLSSDNYHK